MKIKNLTLLAAIFTLIEILRFLVMSYIVPKVVEDWWSNTYVILFDQVIRLAFLCALCLFFISLYINQTKK
jgi:hypothetical protein